MIISTKLISTRYSQCLKGRIARLQKFLNTSLKVKILRNRMKDLKSYFKTNRLKRKDKKISRKSNKNIKVTKNGSTWLLALDVLSESLLALLFHKLFLK